MTLLKRIAAVLALLVAIILPATAESATRYHYPPIVVNSWVQGCLGNGTTGTTIGECQCAVNYIQAHVPYRTFTAENVSYYRGGSIPAYMAPATRACGLAVI